VQEAQRAEAERLRAEATAVRVERERVGAVLWDAVTRSERADAAYQRIWDGRELAPYDEIYDVIHGQVLPEVDGAIGLVSSTTSVDPDGQRAIDAARGCLVALRDAYERDATFNESLTEAANLAEQQAAFDRTNQPCSEWGSLAASLGA
jgi:hypothetical protein